MDVPNSIPRQMDSKMFGAVDTLDQHGVAPPRQSFRMRIIGSINSILAICEATGAEIDEVAVVVASDARIGDARCT
ncbi:hypothetical protein F4824DRAFT_505225 [Ustulina deusta]|nr:hypothetical protein F4824DRAFT_505225 [Ustulina deusta]